MPDERLGMPIHPDYTSAIGLAVYCFASLEWNAVWYCEQIEPGASTALRIGPPAGSPIHFLISSGDFRV